MPRRRLAYYSRPHVDPAKSALCSLGLPRERVLHMHGCAIAHRSRQCYRSHRVKRKLTYAAFISIRGLLGSCSNANSRSSTNKRACVLASDTGSGLVMNSRQLGRGKWFCHIFLARFPADKPNATIADGSYSGPFVARPADADVARLTFISAKANL